MHRPCIDVCIGLCYVWVFKLDTEHNPLLMAVKDPLGNLGCRGTTFLFSNHRTLLNTPWEETWTQEV